MGLFAGGVMLDNRTRYSRAVTGATLRATDPVTGEVLPTMSAEFPDVPKTVTTNGNGAYEDFVVPDYDLIRLETAGVFQSMVSQEVLAGQARSLAQPVATSADLPAVERDGSLRITQDDLHLWVWEDSESAWTDLGSLKGEPGAGSSDAEVAGFINTGTEAAAAVEARASALLEQQTLPTVNLNAQPNVVGDGITDDRAALQAAINSATTLGLRVTATGSFRINSTLYVSTNADLSDATFECYGTGVAVVVGNSSGANFLRKTVRLPKVQCRTKPSSGWAAGTVGVRLLNCYECFIDAPFVWQFETNMEVRGQGSGCVYNTITIGSLNVGKVNLLLSADGTGWSNQNTFVGGRYSSNPAEGVAIPGSAQIKLASDPPYSRPNNNVWLNPSVEGTMHEYMIDCDGGENVFINGRYEKPGGVPPTVRWGPRSYYNVILGGHSASIITETNEPGSVSNMIQATGRWDHMGSKAAPMMRLDNRNSSTQPVWAAWDAATYKDGVTSETTGWRTAAAAQFIGVKKRASAHAEAAFLSADGSLAFGSGAAAPDRKLRAFGAGIAFDNTHVSFVLDGAYDIGLDAYRPRTIRARAATVTGTYTTAQRNAIGPGHASFGAGAMIFDTTLGKPIWSTGSAWVDATGATV